MTLVSEILRLSKMTYGTDIIDYLTQLPTLPFDGALARKFREVTLSSRHITIMWYSQGTQIVLVGMEYHNKKKDYLADEEPFFDEAPSYFSESDHYVSPIYRLKQLREEVSQILKSQRLLHSAIWIVYITNNTLINREDLEDDVWLPERVIVFDNVKRLSPDFCVESLPFVTEGLDVFEYANEHTEWKEMEITQKEDTEESDQVSEESFEPEKAHKLFNFDPDDFDLSDWDSENKEPFSEKKESPYLPTMEDGLRAEVHPRLQNPKEVLNGLVGCQDIREQIRQLTNLHRYNQKIREFNPDAQVHDLALHAIFHGSPGTGKTTLCRLYASLLYEAGVLTQGHVVVATRSTFIGNNFGDEEKAVHAVLKAASGGVLMIDEAYQLNSSHPNDPGKNVLQLMMPVLADEKVRDIAIVLCGYSEPMEKLLSLNEGLASRFPNRFQFPDFTVPQLLEISKLRIRKFNYHFTPKAWKLYKEVVTNIYMNRDKKTWGNAREVSNLLDKIYIHHAERCLNVPTPQKMFTITVADIKPVEGTTPPPQKHCIGFR